MFYTYVLVNVILGARMIYGSAFPNIIMESQPTRKIVDRLLLFIMTPVLVKVMLWHEKNI